MAAPKTPRAILVIGRIVRHDEVIGGHQRHFGSALAVGVVLMDKLIRSRFEVDLTLGIMAPKFTDVPDMSLWSQSIGGLIINFGVLEFQTLRWLQVLGSETAAMKARGQKLSQRIDAVLTLLAASSVSTEQQIDAIALWQEVRELSKVRNRIAHNPLCLGRDPVTNEANFSVIDLKKMMPSGENSLEPLSYRQIAEIALRARDINRSLSRIVEATPNHA